MLPEPEQKNENAYHPWKKKIDKHDTRILRIQWKKKKITHFEAPRSRRKGLPPSHTKLLFQYHPRNSFCYIESLSPISQHIYWVILEFTVNKNYKYYLYYIKKLLIEKEE